MPDNQNQEIHDRLISAVEKNDAESDKEPWIFNTPPAELKQGTPPMDINGTPDISTPQPVVKTITFNVENEAGELNPVTVPLKRLRAKQRESVALLLLQMFKDLNLITEDGLKAENFKEDPANIKVAADYVRAIAPEITGLERDVFDDVPLVDMIRIFETILENEVGLVRTIEMFFSTANQDTKR